jgi:hypothetical protein
MKFLTIVVALLFSASALAMPKYLEGATVTVTLKNGKTYEYKSEEYAVVERDSMGQLAAAQHIIKKVDKAFKEEKIVKNKKNRVYVLAGHGPTGDLEGKTDGSNYSIGHDNGTVGGVGYQRKLNNEFNLGIQVQTNKTTSLSLGVDF